MKDFLTSPSDLACHIFLYVITSLFYISGYLRCFYCLDVSQDSCANKPSTVCQIHHFQQKFWWFQILVDNMEPQFQCSGDILKKNRKISLKKGITTTQQTTKNLKFILNKKMYMNNLCLKETTPSCFLFLKHTWPCPGEQRIAADHPGVTSLPASSSTSAGPGLGP